MTEERYTLEEAAILLNRQACEHSGHRIERAKEPLTFVALENWVEWICTRCDVVVTLVYPPVGATPAPGRPIVLTDLDAEPDFDNVSFAAGDDVAVRTFKRGPLLLGGEVRSPRGRWWAHGWLAEGVGPMRVWDGVVIEANGAPIHAWNDGEWVQGEVKP